MLGKILGPTSADAGTVKATENLVGVPSIVAVAYVAVADPAAVVKPSAFCEELLCEAPWETREESASKACLQLNLAISHVRVTFPNTSWKREKDEEESRQDICPTRVRPFEPSLDEGPNGGSGACISAITMHNGVSYADELTGCPHGGARQWVPQARFRAGRQSSVVVMSGTIQLKGSQRPACYPAQYWRRDDHKRWWSWYR